MSTVGSVNDEGDLVCPHCQTNIITPIGRNPYRNFREEKHTVLAFVSTTCVVCEGMFYLTPEEALKHNRFWHPDEPEFQ